MMVIFSWQISLLALQIAHSLLEHMWFSQGFSHPMLKACTFLSLNTNQSGCLTNGSTHYWSLHQLNMPTELQQINCAILKLFFLILCLTNYTPDVLNDHPSAVLPSSGADGIPLLSLLTGRFWKFLVHYCLTYIFEYICLDKQRLGNIFYYPSINPSDKAIALAIQTVWRVPRLTRSPWPEYLPAHLHLSTNIWKELEALTLMHLPAFHHQKYF